MSVTTPVEEPNPYSVQVILEQSGGAMPGFDPSNLDPSTFDFSTLDPSTFDFSALDDADMDSDDFDLSSLLPGPTTITQEIGPQGGRIEATSSNGTIYSLTIPEGALALPMGISLTPIASLEGLPPQVELLGAVQIEPEGFALSEPALLMITLPDPSSETDDRMVVGIGFGTEGDDFYFLPTVGDEAVATLGGGAAKLAKLLTPPPADSRGGSRVSRLESRGAAKASPAAVIQNRRDNPTADDTRSVSQSAAAADAKNYENDDLAPLIPSPPFEQWLAQNIIDVAKESATGSGAAKNLAEAVDHLEYLERFEDRYSDDLARSKESAWQAVVEGIAAELKKAAAAACDSEEHRYGTKLAQRLAGNGPGRTQSAFDRELARRYSEQHGAKGQDLIRKMLESEAKCPRAFHVKGSLGDTSFDQDVCDYRVEFELTGETPAGDLRHVMRPSYPGFDRGGDYRWSGRLSGGGEEWTASGFGTYLLINDENGWPVKMKLNDTGCGMNGEQSSCQTASGFLPLVPLKKGCGK